MLVAKNSQLVMAGLVPAISLRMATLACLIEVAGTSPAMTQERSVDGHEAIDYLRRAHRPVHAALEVAVDAQRVMVREGQNLGHEHGGDMLRRIDPVIGVEQSRPGEAAGAAATWHCPHGDHVAEPPA